MHTTNLPSYPSFVAMTPKDRSDILARIEKISQMGDSQKWLINFDEMEIDSVPFASGSNSSVHKCKWRGTNIVVKKPKIKKIKILEDLLREIEIWSTLRHPNLVQFLGASIKLEHDDFYILMEKIPGRELGKIIEGTLHNHQKKTICSQLIEAITFLHHCKPPVIFRDLKPDNILIDDHMGLKLTDFGLSRYVPTDSQYIMTGNTGTTRYMAPEVYLNQVYDLRADVYSLGMIFYYIYTQKLPFSGYNLDTIDTYFRQPDLLFSTSLVRNKQFRSIVNNCIEKNKEKRWDIDKVSKNFNLEKGPCTIA